MKEFGTTFRDGLAKGLRASERNPRNQESLTECFNLKPTEEGLRAYDPITNPFAGVTMDWPFPQVFLGADVRILANATQVYELATWTLGSVDCTVTEDQRWDFIDYGDYLILVNGNRICIRDYAGVWTTNTSLSTMPRFSTGCDFRGQVVAGNIKTSWHGCGTGSIIWSRIGKVDFTPGGDNEAGFRNIPWEGDVLRVMELGKGVVAYCENGILLLSPFKQTFGMDTLLEVGIPTKGAVGGNKNIHVFVDTDGNIWRINRSFELQKLGYREYMNLMTAADIVVEHNPAKREFHISSDSYGYILTEQGLAQCYQEVTTVAVDKGTANGLFHDQSDSEARVVTDTLDFGLRGFKTLQTLEFGTYHPANSTYVMNAAVDYRHDKTDGLTRSADSLVNPNGVAHIGITALEFRLAATYTNYASVELDYINTRVKLSDKRSIRGVYSVT